MFLPLRRHCLTGLHHFTPPSEGQHPSTGSLWRHFTFKPCVLPPVTRHSSCVLTHCLRGTVATLAWEFTVLQPDVTLTKSAETLFPSQLYSEVVVFKGHSSIRRIGFPPLSSDWWLFDSVWQLSEPKGIRVWRGKSLSWCSKIFRDWQSLKRQPFLGVPHGARSSLQHSA